MKLTTSARKAIPSSDFALPGGHYPIEDENHARAALSMDHNASPAQRAVIERKVAEKYPGIKQKASADILMRRKKQESKPQPSGPASADILMRRKK